MQNKIKHISKLKNRINNLKNRNQLNNLISSHNMPSNNSRNIVTMQLRNKRR
ncbi:Transposable element P transposase [Aphis craccivora]|uniref:Transposable element P transposase n=1 Tax=Aphis craccivora TaxID=307492 RepID=A0A6G0YVX5_APHCR|nr:Transposable element P transposase [Aphis craccivora]